MALQEPKTEFFENIIKASRKLELDYEFVSAAADKNTARVRSAAENFLEGYAVFNHISYKTAVNSYMETTRRYMRDIQGFNATGKYPLEIDAKQWGISRTDYDLFLMLTILVTRHRCAIMEEIMKTSVPGRPLVIGVGSGIELSFIRASEGGDAYDLYINAFVRQTFSHWNFHEEWYRPSSRRYEVVYAIELLEHLSEPYAFIEDCRESLVSGGHFIATTASNVPQFDHRFNFVSDEDFEQRVSALGFDMESKRLISHEYPLVNIRVNNAAKARNVFYVFRKK
jgi:hypothetical protein